MHVVDDVRDYLVHLRAQHASTSPQLAIISVNSWLESLGPDPIVRATSLLLHVLERAQMVLDEDATLALRLTTTVLDHLPADAAVLRGKVLTIHAQALHAMGDGIGARDTVQEALQLLQGNALGTSEAQAARLVAAYLAHDQADDDLAIRYLGEAMHASSAEGNDLGALQAGMLAAAFLYEHREIARAERLWRSLLQLAERLGIDRERATILCNLGYCARSDNRSAIAQEYFAAAIPLLHACGMDVEAQRVVWNIANLARSVGNLDVISQLKLARDVLVKNGKVHEAGILSLDIIDIAILVDERVRVTHLATELMALFRNAGMAEHLIAAVAHLATSGRAVDGAMIAQVRNMLQRRGPPNVALP